MRGSPVIRLGGRGELERGVVRGVVRGAGSTGRKEEEESRGLLRAGETVASGREREEEEEYMGCLEESCCVSSRRSGSQLRVGKTLLGGEMMSRLMREGGRGRDGAEADSWGRPSRRSVRARSLDDDEVVLRSRRWSMVTPTRLRSVSRPRSHWMAQSETVVGAASGPVG